MKTSQQTVQQIQCVLDEAFGNLKIEGDCFPMTDFHIQIKQETGELWVFDDNDVELSRQIIEDWVNNDDAKRFYKAAAPIVRQALMDMKSKIDKLPVLKPFGFELIDGEGNTVEELYLADDETLILSDDLLPDLEEDLDAFWQKIESEQ